MADHLPIILDVVQTSDFTRIFLADHQREFPAVAGKTSQPVLALMPQPQSKPTEVPGGYFVDIPTAHEFIYRCGSHKKKVLANPLSDDLFAGLNTLFAIEYNPDADDVADWIKVNINNSGAEAALVVRRLGPGKSAGVKWQAIRRALKAVRGLKRFVLLDYRVPLGKPSEPAENERILAPEAPGKALLPAPPDDIWRAQLGQFTVYAAARFRFLARARAVLHCAIADIVGPAGKDGLVFDLAAAQDAHIMLNSKLVYPWKIQTEDNPTMGDHSCQRFDNQAHARIWCARPGLDGNWRPFRARAQPPIVPKHPPEIWRCMSLRHKKLKISQIVPKSSLQTDPTLVALLGTDLDARPGLPPDSAPAPGVLKNDRVLIVTTMKDEGPFILEWIAHHRAIGVRDFLVYTNDCSDGTNDMFDLLQSRGLLEHRENPYRQVNMKPQHAAYQDAAQSGLVERSDWVICMDVDEYINIHVGDGSLRDLFRATGSANLISATWRLFGNADIAGFQDRFITEQFTRCAPKYIRKPHQAWGFKTLFRPLGHYKKFGVHRPKGLRPEALEQIKWVNGSGNPMPLTMLRNGWRNTNNNWGYGLLTLNHYALRSADSYLVKRFRGRVNHVDRDQGMNYWFRMNNNATSDTSILRRAKQTRQEFDALIADPEIRRLHERGVARHLQRIKSLKESTEYSALFDEVTSARMNRLSRMHHHFGSQVFLQGPEDIPPNFHNIRATWDEDTPNTPDDPPPPAAPFYP